MVDSCAGWRGRADPWARAGPSLPTSPPCGSLNISGLKGFVFIVEKGKNNGLSAAGPRFVRRWIAGCGGGKEGEAVG